VSQLQVTHHKILAPIATHKYVARCEDVDCPQYLHGWRTVVGATSIQAMYIRNEANRRFIESRSGEGEITFEFPAGQQCFRQHLAPNGREAIFARQVRGQEGQVLPTPEIWRDDFAEELETIAQIRERHG